MSNTELKVPPVRRVVIGHDHARKALAIRDDIATNISPRANAASTTVWCTEKVPVRLPAEGGDDMGAHRLNSGTPPNGTRLMVMDLFPGCHGAMHRTDTLDYVIVLDGEVEMLMDDIQRCAARRRYPGATGHDPRLDQSDATTRAYGHCADRCRTPRSRLSSGAGPWPSSVRALCIAGCSRCGRQRRAAS